MALMLAVQLDKRRVYVRDVRQTKRPEGYALIRLLVGGICNTGLELQRGYYGFSGIPGHEFVGEVVEADHANLLGRRVVGEINLACRQCEWCQRGLGRHCPKRTVLGIVRYPGAFRELLTLPEVICMWFPIRFPMRKLFSLSRSRRHVRFSIRRPFQRERVLPYLVMANSGCSSHKS